MLKVAEAFGNESNYTVWSDLLTGLSGLSVLLQYTDYHDLYKAYIRKLLTPVTEKMGWEPKPGEGETCFQANTCDTFRKKE